MSQPLTQAAKVCIAVTTTLGFIAIIVVALRFYCRIRVQKIKIGPDDWCALAALIVSTAIAVATNYAAAVTGVGDPTFHPTMDQVLFAAKMNVGLENSQVACMGIIKVSMLFYYKRVLVLETYQRITNALIAIVIAFEFSLIMVILFSKGVPISRQWDPTAPYFVNMNAVLLTFCAGNALLDLLTLALPIIAVRNLQMSTNRKLLVSVIFSLGSFCIIASIIRLYYAVKFTKIIPTPDALFQGPFIYNILWALIEPPVFLLAGCLLTLAPLFRAKIKYGPASWFRSLRSVLLAMRKTTRGTTGSSTTGKGDKEAPYGVLDGNSERISERQLWNPAVADTSAQARHLSGGRLEGWEMRDIDGSPKLGEHGRV